MGCLDSNSRLALAAFYFIFYYNVTVLRALIVLIKAVFFKLAFHLES
jgi:hypothetical protein